MHENFNNEKWLVVYLKSHYTRYWYIWDSLNGTLDKIGHGTRDNVYWVTKNEGTGMALKIMGH